MKAKPKNSTFVKIIIPAVDFPIFHSIYKLQLKISFYFAN